ncbi:energy transducer TonB [Paraburkholderia sediminicola]|uniref:energy transducer TonB n=1 Tax=Paraburkholderia sediminicola TaxID=458836 RepID=UPI0038BD70FE
MGEVQLGLYQSRCKQRINQKFGHPKFSQRRRFGSAIDNVRGDMYYETRKTSGRQLLGLAMVIGLHIFFVYVLVSGLANKAIQMVTKPVIARIVSEPRPAPPKEVVAIPSRVDPPRAKTPPSRQVVRPTPTRPPVAQPATPMTTINVPVATQTAPAAPAPVHREAPAQASVGVVCPNSAEIRSSIRYPREAQRDGITGDVVIGFTVGTNGSIRNVTVVRSADPVLDRAAADAVEKFRCVAQGADVNVVVPFSFHLD